MTTPQRPKPPVGTGIRGLGIALGSNKLGNDAWPPEYVENYAKHAAQGITTLVGDASQLPASLSPRIAELIERYHRDPFRGCHTRYHLAEEDHASDIEILACRRALDDAGLEPDDVDCLLVGSVVPDRVQPNNGGILHQALGLGRAPFVGVEMACASAVGQLMTATALIRSGMYRNVLAVTSTVPSRLHAMSRPVSTGLSDGAAAMVIGPVDPGRGYIDHLMIGMGQYRDAIVFRHQAESEGDGRYWYRGHDGLLMGAGDRSVIKDMLLGAFGFFADVCFPLLDRSGYARSDVDFLAGSSSFAWSVAGYLEQMGLPEERSYDSFPEAGSINGVSCLLNLHEGRRIGRVSAGQLVLVFAPGAGQNLCATLLRL